MCALSLSQPLQLEGSNEVALASFDSYVVFLFSHDLHTCVSASGVITVIFKVGRWGWEGLPPCLQRLCVVITAACRPLYLQGHRRSLTMGVRRLRVSSWVDPSGEGGGGVNSGKLICKSEVWPVGTPCCQLEALSRAVKKKNKGVEEGPGLVILAKETQSAS